MVAPVISVAPVSKDYFECSSCFAPAKFELVVGNTTVTQSVRFCSICLETLLYKIECVI